MFTALFGSWTFGPIHHVMPSTATVDGANKDFSVQWQQMCILQFGRCRFTIVLTWSSSFALACVNLLTTDLSSPTAVRPESPKYRQFTATASNYEYRSSQLLTSGASFTTRNSSTSKNAIHSAIPLHLAMQSLYAIDCAKA